MKDFLTGPDGATGNCGSRHGRILPHGHDGWRKPTAGLAQADQLAETGVQLAVTRSEAIVAVKRVAAQIGLKAGDLLLLDTLCAFSQPQDWEAGRRPLVWASNAYLMERTGFSLSTLKRHARRLVAAGVMTFRDSPNGKRWGHRDAEGRIVEAYGFDLAPLAARCAEFTTLAEEIAAERALCQRLRRQITIARRAIRARLEAFCGQGRAGETFAALLAQLPGPKAGSALLSRLADAFQRLLEEVQKQTTPQAKEESDKEQTEMTPRGAKSDPHIPSTTEDISVSRNSSENEEIGAVSQKAETPVAAEPGLTLGLILKACPEFTSWGRNLGDDLRDWGDLSRIAGKLRPMIGISQDAWAEAEGRMGRPAAAAALALVFEKVSTGEVTSPGGYIRGMAQKAGAGELHLERSFYGRLRVASAA